LASAKFGQIQPEIWPKPNLAEFGKNGRISNLPKPKFGATLAYTQIQLAPTTVGRGGDRPMQLAHMHHSEWFQSQQSSR